MLTRNTVSLILVLVAACYLIRPKTKEGKLVETKSGSVRGIISVSRDGREFYEWLGIPYAKPPVGNLRFASPEPIGRWEGVWDGSQYGSACAQSFQLYKGLVLGDEDCLFLNIHTPKLQNTSATFPVLLFLHFGGFLSFSSDLARPEFLMDEDILFVTMNYRLGVFGFSSTGDTAIRGNMGLKDQVLALKWIQQNIHSFGGDPNKVTIMGTSAGGASVHYLLLSPQSKGLFHKAISLSGTALNPWAFKSPARSIEKTKSLGKEFNCPVDNSEELVACLRSTRVKDLLTATFDDDTQVPYMRPHKFGDPMSPTIELVNDEDAFLTEHPLKIIVEGKAHRIPWMVGHVANESLISLNSFYSHKDNVAGFEANWVKSIKFGFGIDPGSPTANLSASEKAGRIRDFYFPPFERSTLTQEAKMKTYSNLFSDAYINFGVHDAIHYQRQFSPVYPCFYNKPDGPSSSSVLANMYLKEGRLSAFFEMLFYAVRIIVGQSLLGMEPDQDDNGIDHMIDMSQLFSFHPLIQIPNTSKHYEFSRSYVKLFVDFAKDKSLLKFRGTELPATPKQGDLHFLEIKDLPKIIKEPFKERMEFLRGLQIRDYNLTDHRGV